MIRIIAACCDKNMGIGLNNKLPWKLPEDLKWFKTLTNKNTVVMGRKTFESLDNKPLPNRFNIVYTNNKELLMNNHNNKEVLLYTNKLIEKPPYCPLCIGDLWVVGGAKIYETYIKSGLADELYITKVYGDYKVDAYFPYIDSVLWKEEPLSEVMVSSNGTMYQFMKYKRK